MLKFNLEVEQRRAAEGIRREVEHHENSRRPENAR